MSGNITLYHGSANIIEIPEFGKGNAYNDYGLGFYCTENLELAKEWACNDKIGGYANTYTLDVSPLRVLDLSEEPFSILNWLSVLVNNRTFSITNPIAAEAKDYLTAHFLPEVNAFDAIEGYRADDSYFTFALDFLNNTISIRQLSRAMKLGSLGKQFVLISRKAFDKIRFIQSESADWNEYYSKRKKRDLDARNEYLSHERSANRLDDVFMIDILREEMRQDDARLQRNLY